MSHQSSSGNTLRVRNLTDEATEADLRELFAPFGAVKSARINKDWKTGRSIGVAFVAFYEHQDAVRAREKLNGYGYNHLLLSVDWTQPKK